MLICTIRMSSRGAVIVMSAASYEDEALIKHGESTDQVTRVGSAVGEQSTNSGERGIACTGGRKGFSEVTAAISKNMGKIFSTLGTKELLVVKISCAAYSEDTHDSEITVWKF